MTWQALSSSSGLCGDVNKTSHLYSKWLRDTVHFEWTLLQCFAELVLLTLCYNKALMGLLVCSYSE